MKKGAPTFSFFLEWNMQFQIISIKKLFGHFHKLIIIRILDGPSKQHATLQLQAFYFSDQSNALLNSSNARKKRKHSNARRPINILVSLKLNNLSLTWSTWCGWCKNRIKWFPALRSKCAKYAEDCLCRCCDIMVVDAINNSCSVYPVI